MSMKDKKAFQDRMTKLKAEYPALERVNENTLTYPNAFICEIRINNKGGFFVYYGIADDPCIDAKRFWTQHKELQDAESFYIHVKTAIADYLGIQPKSV